MKKLVIVGLVILFIIDVIYLVSPSKENKYLWAKQKLE